ncbi:MAG: tetratricopeptide repeat protein [Nannocystaceae bacterium]
MTTPLSPRLERSRRPHGATGKFALRGVVLGLVGCLLGCAHTPTSPSERAALRARKLLDACPSDAHECRACEGGDLDACVAVSRRHVGEDWQLLLAYACDQGGSLACSDLADAQLDGGQGLAADAAASVPLFRRGCDLSPGHGCLGLAYLSTLEGAPFDAAEVRTFLDRRCVDGNRGACATLGRLLDTGLGGPLDLEGAFARFDRACTLGDRQACVFRSTARAQGLGVAEDRAAALAELERLCAGDEQDACKALKDGARPTSFFERSMRLSDEQWSALLEAAKGDQRSVDVEVCVAADGAIDVHHRPDRGGRFDTTIDGVIALTPLLQPLRAGRSIRACVEFKLEFGVRVVRH